MGYPNKKIDLTKALSLDLSQIIVVSRHARIILQDGIRRCVNFLSLCVVCPGFRVASVFARQMSSLDG